MVGVVCGVDILCVCRDVWGGTKWGGDKIVQLVPEHDGFALHAERERVGMGSGDVQRISRCLTKPIFARTRTGIFYATRALLLS